MHVAVVDKALRTRGGGRVIGVVLRWPKLEGNQYGEYKDVTLANVPTLVGEQAMEARAAGVALALRRPKFCKTACGAVFLRA